MRIVWWTLIIIGALSLLTYSVLCILLIYLTLFATWV